MSAYRPVVLVVDDEPRILSFLSENLATDDFVVHVATSVAHARSKINAYRPDIVLLDVGLPDGSGFDLCREVRDADPLLVRFNPQVPIIMLTARADEVDRVRGFQRGADDFVPKPFHYPELLARIGALLRRASAGREHEVLQVAGISWLGSVADAIERTWLLIMHHACIFNPFSFWLALNFLPVYRHIPFGKIHLSIAPQQR